MTFSEQVSKYRRAAKMTQEELAKTMGKSQSAVANKLRLLSLPDDIQKSLLKEQISERHARALINIPDSKKQKEMLKKIIDNKMSVRSVEEEIKRLYSKNNDSTQARPELSNNEQIATTNAFVNSSPLMPTAELPADESNFGKVTIAPPEGEAMPTGKFINYGEIDKAREEEINNQIAEKPPAITSIDINDLKSNTNDISTPSGGSSLDNLLNIGGQTSFITPAEQIVKTESTLEKENKSKDYFNNSDLSAFNIPQETSNISPMNNGMIPISNVTDENYTIEEATEKIRNLVEDLKAHGINISTNEMNFEKSFQIIIKLYKENKELKENAEALHNDVGQYKNIESSIQNTLIIAQKTADEVQNVAKKQAEQIIKDAEYQAKTKLDEINTQLMIKEKELDELKKQFSVYKAKMESLLISQLELIKDMAEDEE